MNRWYKKDPTPVRRLTNNLQNPTRFARFSIESRCSQVFTTARGFRRKKKHVKKKESLFWQTVYFL